MRLRRSKTHKPDGMSRRELRTLAGLAALITLPAIATALWLFRPTGPYMLNLVPRVRSSDGFTLLDWSGLERGSNILRADAPSNGAPIRALGYMTCSERVRPGQPVGRFVLTADNGDSWQRFERYGDGMIDVRLREGLTIPYSEGSLVWVWGTLRALPGDPAGDKPLYALEGAWTRPAGKADIFKYYR